MKLAAKKPQQGSPWYVITFDDLMPFFVFLLALFIPNFSSDIQFKVIERELSVGFIRTAPPFAALMDENIPQIEIPNLEGLETENLLLAGDVNTTSLVAALEGARQSMLLSEKLYQVNLQRKRELNSVEETKANTPMREPNVRYLEGITVSMTPESLRPVERSIERIPVSNGFAQRLSEFTSERVAMNETIPLSPTSQDFREPVTGLVEVPEQKWVGSVLVGKPEAVARVVSRKPSKSGKNSEKRNSNRGSRVAKYDVLSAQTDSPSAFGLTASGNANDGVEPDIIPNFMKVRGKIELSSGLAFLGGSDQLRVSWRAGLVEKRVARIDGYSGTYELEIDDPSQGAIIAELRGPSGEIIAVEEYLVAEVLDSYNVNSGYANLSFKLEPIDHDVSGKVYVVDANGKLQKPKNGRLSLSQQVVASLKGAKYKIDRFLKGSSLLSLFRSERSFDGIFYTTAGTTATNTLPSGQLLSKILDLTSFDPSLKNYGLIWGQVVRDGSPVEGATVELSHSPAKGPYYLDEDGSFNESQTSTLGYYAFVSVPEDTYLVRATQKDKVFSPQITVVINGAVTNTNIDIDETNRFEVYVTDIENYKPLSVSVMFYGDEVEHSSQSGRVELTASKGSLPNLIEARAHEPGYYPVVTSFSRKQKSLALDMPKRTWVNELLSKNRISTLPNSGIIIGQIFDTDFQVNLPKSLETQRVIYFDHEGNYVNSSGASFGLQGGGFIIANVPEGPHQIAIKSLDGKRSFVTEAIVHSDTAFSFQQRL